MSIQIRDTLTPALAKLAQGIQHKQPILHAMGKELESITRAAFDEPALRPKSWKAKWDGSPATLRKNQMLVRSIVITEVTDSHVTVGTDRIYAAIHQFGGIIRAKGKSLRFQLGNRTVYCQKVTMPARPFFPFINGRMTPLAQERIRKIGERQIALLTRPGGSGGAA